MGVWGAQPQEKESGLVRAKYSNDHAPDLDLVERSRAGDTQAFDELVEKYTPKLYGLV